LCMGDDRDGGWTTRAKAKAARQKRTRFAVIFGRITWRERSFRALPRISRD